MKNIFISGFALETNNRGTQALGYGALSFLETTEKIDNSMEVISPSTYKNPLKYWKKRVIYKNLMVGDVEYRIKYRKYWHYDILFTLLFYRVFGFVFALTPFGRDIKNMSFAAAICGGDGFSDIYSGDALRNHLKWVSLAGALRKPYIILPQTIGPFNEVVNFQLAESILKGAKRIYVRDTAFVPKLEQMNLNYEITDDLSYYMKKETVDIAIEPNSIGINISGLCYYNSFHSLASKFDNYKFLIEEIVKAFQKQGRRVYLIPHSYNSFSPEPNADDLQASKDFYYGMKDKKNVVLIGDDLKSPQIKYLISKMSFFVGSRMHSCFAAIYTNTPIFGLGYSYKYEHNFNKYNLGDNFVSVVDLDKNTIPFLVDKIIGLDKESLSK